MILDDLAASSQRRVDAVMHAHDGANFRAALAKPGLSFICEVKRASPSKGMIAQDFPYLDIAREYAAAGADAISVLTEPEYFKGSVDYLREIAAAVPTPVLRKDFVVDELQLYEAKLIGASAVLLICAILGPEQLARYIAITRSLHIAALVEAHSEDEMKMAADAGADIVGVNNRDLKTFTVDLANFERLRRFAPKDAVVIAESGIFTAADARRMRDSGADAVLVGESLMRAADKKAMLAELRG
jgi:indole-3-glycerol phosphate synthase